MASTDSAVPDQSTDEQIEKKVNEELKVVEQVGISPSKEDGELTDAEQKLKSEELASPEAPVVESEGKIDAIVEVEKAKKADDALPVKEAPKATEVPDAKLDVPSVSEPVVEVVEKEPPKEQPKIFDSPETEVPPTQETAPEVGNKPEEASEANLTIVDKPEEASEADLTIVDKPESAVEEPQVGKEPEEVPKSVSQIVEEPEPVVEEPQVAKESEEVSELESRLIEKPESAVEEPQVVKESESESTLVEELKSALVVEEKLQEKSEVVEEVEKKSEMFECKESDEGEILVKEPDVGKEPEQVSDLESKEIEKPESVVEVEEKPQEQSDVVEEAETKSEVLEHKKSEDVEHMKDEGVVVHRAKEIKESEEGEFVKDEGVVVDNVEEVTDSLKDSETVLSTNQEIPSDPKDGVSFVLPDLEKANVEDTKKDESGVDVVEGLSKEAALEVEKVEKQNVKVEESTQPETTKTEDASDSITAEEVVEKSFEVEKACGEVEVVTEEKKEANVEDYISASTETETTKDRDIKEPVEELRELELEAKANDTVEALDEVDKAVEVVEETVKSDDPHTESPKDNQDLKTDGGPPKEVPTKSIQKQSNNIISKVKQSFVKVKKAIIGKSPSSKTISSDVKGDIKVK